jgi:drug/metabolite transporter (DMT)-like permease
VISIVFGLGTAVCFATSGLINSRVTKIIGPWSTVAWVMLFGLVITLPWVFLSGIPENLADSALFLFLAGAGNIGGLILVSFAFRIGKVGVVAPIVATEGALSAVIAALTGESIAPIIAFLLMAVVVGIVIAAIAPDPEPLHHERPVLAAIFATAASVSFGIGLFTAGTVSADLPIAWVLLPARLVGIIALAIPLAITGRLLLTRRTAPWLMVMSTTEVVGTASFAVGAAAHVGVTSVLASQFAPISAVMAYVLFREKLGRLQIAGVSILVVAVTALAFAS